MKLPMSPKPNRGSQSLRGILNVCPRFSTTSQTTEEARVKRIALKVKGSSSRRLLLITEKLSAQMTATNNREPSTIIDFFEKTILLRLEKMETEDRQFGVLNRPAASTYRLGPINGFPSN